VAVSKGDGPAAAQGPLILRGLRGACHRAAHSSDPVAPAPPATNGEAVCAGMTESRAHQCDKARARRANRFNCRFDMVCRCPALCAKIFCFRFFRSCDLLSSFRSDTRGVCVVTNVVRNAVDVKALSDERRSLRTVKSCGPGAPMQALSPSEAEKLREGDGGKRWFTGEITYKP